MAVGLSIKFDDKALRQALEQAPKLAMRSAVTAINKTAAQAQTASVRRLSAATRIPVRKLRERTKLQKARFNRSPFARLVALTAGVPIDTLVSRGLKKGGISAAGQRFPHASRAPMRNGKELIMERRVVGGQRVPRLPIDRVKIPLEPEATAIFTQEVTRLATTAMPALFERDFRFRLERGR